MGTTAVDDALRAEKALPVWEENKAQDQIKVEKLTLECVIQDTPALNSKRILENRSLRVYGILLRPSFPSHQRETAPRPQPLSTCLGSGYFSKKIALEWPQSTVWREVSLLFFFSFCQTSSPFLLLLPSFLAGIRRKQNRTEMSPKNKYFCEKRLIDIKEVCDSSRNYFIHATNITKHHTCAIHWVWCAYSPSRRNL